MSTGTFDVSALKDFCLNRILDEDPKQKSAILLGSIQRDGADNQAIVILEKTHFPKTFYASLSVGVSREEVHSEPVTSRPSDAEEGRTSVPKDVFSQVRSLGQNDIYTWLLAWLSPHRDGVENNADVKLTLICPATQIHVDKYSAQRKVMVSETPEMYAKKVLPWIESFPPSRIQWVYNILEHKKEAETILYEDPDPKSGFVIVPDLKWDQKTNSSLYIQAIVHDRSLRSLRDLTVAHVDLLLAIRDQASDVAHDKYGLEGRVRGSTEGNVRCFIHYQPSY